MLRDVDVTLTVQNKQQNIQEHTRRLGFEGAGRLKFWFSGSGLPKNGNSLRTLRQRAEVAGPKTAILCRCSESGVKNIEILYACDECICMHILCILSKSRSHQL